MGNACMSKNKKKNRPGNSKFSKNGSMTGPDIEDLFIKSAHSGDLATLQTLKEKVHDFGKIRGVRGFVSLFDDQLFEFQEWNPLLLAIFGKHSETVMWLIEEYQNQHLRSLLSEPLSNSEGRTKSVVQ